MKYNKKSINEEISIGLWQLVHLVKPEKKSCMNFMQGFFIF
jgi:hypothetical protein